MKDLIETADFIIALDGAVDRFQLWDVVVGDLDSISSSENFDADTNGEDTDLLKALMKYESDTVVEISGGRVNH